MKIARGFLWGLAILCLLLPAIGSAATEITYWDQIRPGDGSPRGTALAKILERFQAKNPDIRLKVEVMPAPLIQANLIQSATVGSGPDVSQVNYHQLRTIATAGALQPLDDFATSADKSGWLIPWNIGLTFINGKKYALPYGYRLSALLYRKDVLDRYGVQVPTTWDEVCTAGGKINSPQVMGFGFGLNPSDDAAMLMELTEDVLLAAGSEMFDEQERLMFNNAAGVKVFQLIADLVGRCKASGPQVVELGYATVDEGLKAGTIAMATMGTHRFTSIRAGGARENLQWAPPPSFEEGKLAATPVMSWVVAMGKFTTHPKEAWRLMQYLTSPEAQVFLAQAAEIPTRKSTLQDPWFNTPEAKNMVGWSEYLEKYGRSISYPKTWPPFTQIFATEAQAVVLKGEAPADALRNVVEKYNKLREQSK
jgi:multiple sugar transport system substrate-binding protein